MQEGTQIHHSRPAYGILDCLPGSSEHRSCRELRAAEERNKPKAHSFRHGHSTYGMPVVENTSFVNTALLAECGDIANLPWTLNLRPHDGAVGRSRII
jgi:hypothetical protein